jgi:hypothetical protein
VVLKSATSDYSQTLSADADGAFEATSVPVGAYRVTVTRGSFAPASEDVVDASSSAPVVHFQLPLGAVQEVVNVQESAWWPGIRSRSRRRQ